MSIFPRLFRARDKPADGRRPKNSLLGNAYSFFFGGTASGKAVNERTAMQTTAVYSCVRILAEAIASLPLHVYRYKDDGGKENAIMEAMFKGAKQNIQSEDDSKNAVVGRRPPG